MAVVGGFSWTGAEIIRHRCGLILSESPDTVDERMVCSLNSLRVKIWIPGLKQPKSGERVSDIGASSSTEDIHGSPD
jgi:hypothetical protein